MTGGIDGRTLDSAILYLVDKDKTNTMTPMNYIRKDHGCCICQSDVFVIAGDDNVRALDSVERYNISTDEWTVCAPIPTGMWSVNPCSFEDKYIYILGGEEYGGAMTNVQQYTVDEDAWKVLSVKIPRDLHGVNVHQISSTELIFIGGTTNRH